jgi:GTPase-associated system helical domain
MSGEIILRFLKAGLINVGGDDSKLEKLRETATDLADALKNTPSKAVPFALIAFDPDAPANDPVIKEAAEGLQKRWPTYVNTFSGTPVAVLRALLLDALVKTAKEHDNIAVGFIMSARNTLPFTEANNERDIWTEVVCEIEQSVDTRAEAEWSTPDSIDVPSMAFEPLSPINVSTSPVAIDTALLTKQFEAAAGPNSTAGATGGNPHWPSANQTWVTQFGSRLSEAVAGALKTVADSCKVDPIDLSGPLSSLAQAVSDHVNQTIHAVSGATAGLQRRTNLIWWKESLYSPSAHVSYREMPSATAAAALMAYDLHMQVPTFSPASVAAFLHEAVLTLPFPDLSKSRAIGELLTEAAHSNKLVPLQQASAELVSEPNGRGPLLGIIGHGIRYLPVEDRAFRDLVGISTTTVLTVPEWAKWIFRELQAARACARTPEESTGGATANA